MKYKTTLILIILSLLIIAGCKDVSFNQDSEVVCIPVENITSICADLEQKQIEDMTLNITLDESDADIIIVEGDLIDLNVTAVDPDGDMVYYNFSAPFDKEGNWQTKRGDAGFYQTTVLATDGLEIVSKDIIIYVKARNSIPEIIVDDIVYFDEGTNMVLPFNITDADGDEVVYTISGWIYGSRYPLDYNSAGTYEVVIDADDGKDKVSKTFTAIINNVNRPTEISVEELSVVEGQTITVKPTVFDPDGDKVEITFGAPLNDNGSWTPEIGDEGVTEFEVFANDGTDKVSAKFEITVLPANKAPVLELVEDLVVEEGDSIKFTPIAYDPEGDDITVKYSGWMSSNEYTTTYNDEGEYIVTITVSDATHDTFQHVKVTVLNKNRAPIFIADEV